MQKLLKQLIAALLTVTVFSGSAYGAGKKVPPPPPPQETPKPPDVLAPRAEAPATCEDGLNACDEALKQADLTILAYKQVITAQTNQIDALTKEADQVRKQRDSIWRNPVLYFALGVLVTGATTAAIAHAFNK